MAEKKNQKLKDESLRARQIRTCILFAELCGPQQVADTINEEFGCSMDRQRVWKFSKQQKWSRIIRFLRARFLLDFAKIPIANKSIRIKYLQKVYTEALTESLKSRSRYGEVYELKLGAAISAIQAAREEVEGKTPPMIIDKFEQHLHITTIDKLHILAKKGQDAKGTDRTGSLDAIDALAGKT